MSRQAALKKVTNALNAFTLYEMPKLVMYSFPDLKWKKIKRDLISQKMPVTAPSIRKLILASVKDAKTTVLEDIFLNLFIQIVSHHPERRSWHVYRMKKGDEDVGDEEDPVEWADTAERVVSVCRRKGKDCGVNCLKHDGFFWIGLTEKKVVRTKGMVWKKPVIFAFVPYEPYLYVSGPVGNNLLDVVAEALNYHTPKIQPLYGRHLPSLHKCVIRKAGKASNPDLNSAKYVDGKPKVSAFGTDYSQHENRMQYAEKVFDDDMKVEKLEIEAKNVKYRGSLLPDLIGKEIPFKLTFKSRNLADTFKEMVRLNCLDLTKPADFLQRIPVEGKTAFRVKDI